MSEFDFATNIGDLLSLALHNHVFTVCPDLDHEHAGKTVSIIEIEPNGQVLVKALGALVVFSIPPRFLRRTSN